MAESLKLHFLKPGLLSTIQDGGRNGYQHLGIPVNGFMDQHSAREANRLVGNDLNGPVLEITLMGPQIQFEGSGQMAITGANLSPTLNGEALAMFETFDVANGDEIRFGRPQNGCRAYLSIGGKWQVQPWLGSVSASAVQPETLTPDSVIYKNSVIEVHSQKIEETRYSKEGDYIDFGQPNNLKVLPGPEFSRLSNLAIASFFSQEFIISNDSNRMGYRLKGMVKNFDAQQEVISSGIIPGTIQLTNSGQPIIMMADAQTSGGYTRIANLTQVSIDQLAQMKPGESVRFILA